MQADLFGTKKNRPDIKSGELPIPTFTYHLPLRGIILPEGGEYRIIEKTCCSFHYSEQDRTLQWKEPATGVKKTGHRSGTKERIGEKHKEKDVILKKHEHSIWY